MHAGCAYEGVVLALDTQAEFFDNVLEDIAPGIERLQYKAESGSLDVQGCVRRRIAEVARQRPVQLHAGR